MDSTCTENQANNPTTSWAVLTSCSENYKFFLLENPSIIGSHLNNGLLTLQNQGHCEIIKGEDFTYFIRACDTPLMLEGKLLNNQELVKLESGDKISFSIENYPTRDTIQNFVFSSIYIGGSDNFTNKALIQEQLKCPICYEIIYDCITLDCMHNFCSYCIMNSLERFQLCPLCKQGFTSFKKNQTINDICKYYHHQYPSEEISQDLKLERDESLTKSKFEDKDGNIYDGQWKNIKKHGDGKLLFKTGDFFSGTFHNDFMTEGTMQYFDGSLYTGSWKDNKRDGQGILEFYVNGKPFEYRGAFQKDLRHGKGILVFKAENIEYSFFEGLFYEGNPDLRGEIHYKNEDYYDGEITCDFKRNGVGRMEFADGSRYEGDWWDDKRQGKGKYVFPMRIFSLEKEYQGDWKDDKIEGEGTMSYTNGDIYTGYWVQGFQEGKGEMKYADGSKYYGDWVDGKKNGTGEMIDSNGITYRGEYCQDKISGCGEIIHPIEGCFQMVSLD